MGKYRTGFWTCGVGVAYGYGVPGTGLEKPDGRKDTWSVGCIVWSSLGAKSLC